MRTSVLIAVSSLAVGLAAGCSHATVDQPGQTRATGPESSRTGAPGPTGTTGTSAAAPTSPTPPRVGAPVDEVIGWIEAGRPADVAGYHRATRDGETTDLGDDVAFTTPAGPSGGTTRCLTDSRHTGGALACLVDLADPPTAPAEVYGEWKGNWVDFDGITLQVGSAHGDPGPFHTGDGPELPNGAVLSFGDYRCRPDRTDLFCVNYAHRSAVRLGPAGVAPFGCLHQVPAPPDAGRLFRC